MENKNENVVEREYSFLKPLTDREKLAAKKARIYSKILTEQALASDMEELSKRHEKAATELEGLRFGKKCKKEKENENEA